MAETIAVKTGSIPNILSYCPTCGTYRPHFYLPICLATCQEIPRRQRKRCLLLRWPSHLGFRPGRVHDRNVLGLGIRSCWSEACPSRRLLRHTSIFDPRGILFQYLDGISGESNGRLLKWCLFHVHPLSVSRTVSTSTVLSRARLIVSCF